MFAYVFIVVFLTMEDDRQVCSFKRLCCVLTIYVCATVYRTHITDALHVLGARSVSRAG